MNVPFHLLLVRAFHAQKNLLAPRLPEVGLSSGQPKILHYLIGHNHCMQKDLAENCDIEPATVSRLMENMEQAGLIKRGFAPGNRRAVRVSITEAGTNAYNRWEEICDVVELTSLKGFTPAEKQQFSEYLARMYQNMTGHPIE